METSRQFFVQDIRDMCSSRRCADGEQAEGRCSTQEENDVRMAGGCGEIRNGDANTSLR